MRHREHVLKTTEISLREQNTKPLFTRLEMHINRDVIDGAFTVGEDGVVKNFALPQNGRELDRAETFARLEQLVTPQVLLQETPVTIAVAYTTTLADGGQEAAKYGVVELIGEGRSDFTGSSAARIHNIKTAMDRINGALIPPGEEFSFVELLGEVDAANGYLPELVIKRNATEKEYGGGVCQVSTTVFRAAVLTGMDVTARRNHSFPVQYYRPYGFDATIYLPSPDLRFRNNTDNYILLQAHMEGTELVFEVYGTNDGREVAMDGPYIIERRGDGGMRTVFTQKVYNTDGTVRFEDKFYSNYRSPADYPFRN
jgi:vancomycin resistance protein YoaR